MKVIKNKPITSSNPGKSPRKIKTRSRGGETEIMQKKGNSGNPRQDALKIPDVVSVRLGANDVQAFLVLFNEASKAHLPAGRYMFLRATGQI